jgi:DNA-binding MarR family transcriptional regulator
MPSRASAPAKATQAAKTANPPKTARKPRTRAEAATYVLRKLRLVFNTVKGHFREIEKKTGVAGAQVWALSVVRDRPGIGVNELAQAMDIHQSTASNLLKPMIESGLIVSERAEKDRRALRLRIAAKGLTVLRRAPGPAVGLLPMALSTLDVETLARLDEDLDALIRVLHPDKRAAKVPIGQPEQ